MTENNKKISKILLVTAAVFLLFFTIKTKTNSQFNLGVYDAFQIQLTPASPGPNTDVRANIVSYTFDADSSVITWTLNGKIVEQGRGKKVINFKTGDIGSTIALSVFVLANTGRQTEQKLNFKVGDVDLLLQPLTYAPPYYKGSPKPTLESSLKIVAIPQGLGDKKNLIFEWKKNYKNIPDASGLGKDSYVFPISLFESEIPITLVVSDIGRNYTFQKMITVKTNNLEIVLYEEHPLSGPLSAKSLKNEIKISQPNIVLRAEPYYFPAKDLESLSYEWRMNNKKIETPAPPNLLGLTSPQESQGYSIINIEIRNPKSLLQRFSAMLKINF